MVHIEDIVQKHGLPTLEELNIATEADGEVR